MKLKNKFFIFLMAIITIVSLASCQTSADIVRVNFTEDEYRAKAGQEVDLAVKIQAGSNYSASQVRKELVYESADESVAKVINGVLVAVGYGETEIKVEWSKKAIVFDRAKLVVGLEELPAVSLGENVKTNMIKTTTQSLEYNLSEENEHVSVLWESLNPEVVKLEDGTLTAMSVGKATLVATLSDGVYESKSEFVINVIESDFAINYVLNGGVNALENPVGYSVLKTPIALLEASRNGYTFAGWFTSEDFSKQVNEIGTDAYGDITLYAKWEVNEYNLTFDLAGGKASAELPAKYTIEDEIVLPEFSKLGYKFLGWFDGETKVEKIEKGSTGDRALTAKFEVVNYSITYELGGGTATNPETYTVEDEFELAAATKTGFIFLGWFDGETKVEKIEKGSTGDRVLTAKWQKQPTPDGKIHVGEGLDYATLSEALAAATSGDVIVVAAGTYAENVDVNVANVTILGPNSGVKGQAENRADEAVFSGTFVISANGVVLDGLKFVEEACVQIGKVDGFTLTNSFITATPKQAGTSNRYGCVINTAACVNVTISNCYINSGSNGNQRGTIAFNFYTTNTTITGNKLENEVVNAKSINESIMLYNIGGYVVISENEIICTTDNYSAYLGQYTNTCTSIEITDNVFKGVNDLQTCGLRVQNLGANATFNFVHNQIMHAAGNTFNFNASAEGSNINIKYNYFDENTKYKLTTAGKGTITYEGNYFAASQVTATSDYGVITSLEELEKAYIKSLPPVAVDYHLNGGKLPEGALTERKIGETFVLPVPIREGYVFLGWSLKEEANPTFITEIAPEVTEVVSVYAYWEEARTVLEVGEGKQYATIDEAMEAAEDGNVISIAAGSYELNGAIVKSLTFKGEGSDVTTIKVKHDNPGNLNAALIVFEDVTLRGNGGGVVAGTTFQAGANLQRVIFKNSHLTQSNSFFKAQTAANNKINVEITNCLVDYMGQFFMWNTKSVDTITVTGSTFDLSTCGAVTNAAAAVFRLRSGSAYMYNNTFIGDVTNITGIFENSVDGEMVEVKYNTFKNVTKFVRINAGNEKPVVFDENLYLSDDKVLTSVPATIKGNGITADTTICSSEEDRALRYAKFVEEQEKAVYSNINYVLNEGSLPVGTATTYMEGKSFKLPVPTRADYKFLGWTLEENGTEYITELPNDTKGDVTVYAQWEEIIYEYDIEYVLNGGSFTTTKTVVSFAGEPVTSVNTTSNGNYWSLYKSNIFLLDKSNATSPLYSFRVQLTMMENGTLVVTSVAQSGISSPFNSDYIIVVAEESELYAGIESFRTTVTEGLVASIEVNEAGVGTVKFYEASAVKVETSDVTVDAPSKYSKLTLPLTLPLPSLEGKDFYGWYKEEDFSGERLFVLPEGTTGNIKLYARFVEIGWVEPVFAKLEFVLNGGTLENAPTEYEIGKELELPVPFRTGFKFLGWSLTEGGTEYITKLSAQTTGDVKLFANWEEDTRVFKVVYNLNGGNTLYASREALVADLLADLSKAANKTITVDNFKSQCRKPEFSAFVADDVLFAKWKWIFQYFKGIEPHEDAAAVYDEVINNRKVVDNFWFLTRDFWGFCAKVPGAFYYEAKPIDFTKYANADGFWDLIQTQVTDNNVKNSTILTPNRPYYTFLGWYDNAEFTGEAVKSLDADATLYAKWEKTTVKLTYVLNNSEATMSNTLVSVHASDSFELETPSYQEKYWKFNGWYLDEALTKPVYEVKEYTQEDITVYASWTEIQGYTIKYVLNGGSLIYKNRDAVINDFFKDYVEVMGKTYTSIDEISQNNFADIDYHTFYTKSLPNGAPVRSKWLWLAKYLLEVSTAQLASNNCNVLGLKALVNETPYSGDAIYGISYAFRAFLKGTVLRAGSSYTSVDFSVYENANGFWDILSKEENSEYLNNKGTVKLPEAYLENYTFDGWYLNPEFTGEKVTEVTDNGSTWTLYAKFVEATPVESISITNKINEIKRFDTLQLTWVINPTDANIQTVKFESSNPKVASVDNNGLVTALENGKTTIKIISQASGAKSDSFELEVYSPDHFEVSYATDSFVKVSGKVELVAEYVRRDGQTQSLVWESLNPEIATVADGVVTGVKEGVATIRVKLADNSDVVFDFVVTILPESVSKALQEAIDAHNSNLFVKYELGIGAGGPAYYRDIYSSVSQLLFNDPLEIDRSFESVQAGITSNHGGKKESTEFITVHYTGNMSPGATAKANASYFAGGGGGTSIHYVTGNDGVYHCLDDSLIAYHAGDGTSVKFQWIKTGVKHNESDPKYPVWGISANSKFTINGVETSVDVPEGTTDATKHVTGNTFMFNGTVQNCINDMGLAFKVENGEYYMGTTWWCYSQIGAGRICNKGGNANSIGIESAVNPESDLWLTWHKTAQLVARLMVENNLDITRVVGHHFYTAKDCPQPLLENNLEIWWVFIDMVEHEYKLLTELKDATYEMTVNEADKNIVSSNGRVSVDEFAKVVTYTVKVTVNGQSEEITLASAVNGVYSKNCGC